MAESDITSEDLDFPIEDYDRDSIHTMALSNIPLKVAGLRRARLIKSVSLETKLELFREDGAGSAQIEPEEIPDFFEANQDDLFEDMKVINRLAELTSFDVYSLRIGLRKAGIKVDDEGAFQLSEDKVRELYPFMRNLTRPLIAYIYGKTDIDADDTIGLIELFTNPDTRSVITRLKSLSEALNTTIEGLPGKLQEFGDVFLSLCYYRSYFTYVLPKIGAMNEWAADVRENSFLNRDDRLVKRMKQIEQMLIFVARSVKRRFDLFDKEYQIDWDKVNIENFDYVQQAVTKHHASLGETLCGLTVKIYEWEHAFPNGGGSPDKRSDFMTSEIAAGLELLVESEKSSPELK